MRLVLANEGREGWTLHTYSARGTHGESRIPPQGTVTFNIPEGHNVMVKLLGRVLSVRPFLNDHPKYPLPKEVL